MQSICGANCGECLWKETCRGCAETCGKPFGGRCVAAEYIRVGGKEAYLAFKQKLKDEINEQLAALGLPEARSLNELPGDYVNLGYRLPSGETVSFLDRTSVYLGTQIEIPDCESCVGVIADASFLLICRYGGNGSNPELVLYKKR